MQSNYGMLGIHITQIGSKSIKTCVRPRPQFRAEVPSVEASGEGHEERREPSVSRAGLCPNLLLGALLLYAFKHTSQGGNSNLQKLHPSHGERALGAPSVFSRSPPPQTRFFNLPESTLSPHPSLLPPICLRSLSNKVPSPQGSKMKLPGSQFLDLRVKGTQLSRPAF